MELCYYSSEKGNFGDDLNPYILKQLCPGFEEVSDNRVLYMIGTILFDGFVGTKGIKQFETKEKIVFGSGIRYINNPPKIDNTWNVRFLRGPLSSTVLLREANHFITDPAYLVRSLPVFKSISSKKTHRISVIPHFLSLDKLDWPKLCKELGVNFINPSERNLELILEQIAGSELVITEAMHGAIIADALRVPWKRVKWFSHFYEQEMVSEFKWADWLASMDLKNISSTLPYNRFLKEVDKRLDIGFLKNFRIGPVKESFESILKDDLYQLSDDTLLENKMEQLNVEVEWLNHVLNK